MRVWSKRIGAAAGGLLLTIGLLAGCAPAGEEPPQEIQWSFAGTPCTVTLADTQLQGLCSHSLEGLSAFAVQEPDSLSGMTVERRQETYTLQLAGLTQKRSGRALEQSAFGRLFSALDGACAAGLTWEEGRWRGQLSTGETVTAETQTDGALLTLTVPAWQLTARFSPGEDPRTPLTDS